MLLQLALSLSVATAAQDTGVQRGSVRGTVQSEPSGLPVPMAVVELETERGTFRSIASSSGVYVLHKIPAGRSTLRVRHLEHAPTEMEVLVPQRNTLELHVVLDHRPIMLAQVDVRALADSPDTASASASERAMLDVRALENAANTSRVVRTPRPDGEPGSEDDFYVRGAAADLQLVLLDGAPVYAPFHMGGLIESFDPGVLRSARLYLGGAPARYDGGLSYVMDLTTRAPDRSRHASTGALDVVSARGLVEGPLPGGASYLASSRVLHGAGFSGLDESGFPYRYRDGLVRVQAPLPDGATLSFTGFGNAETARVDTIGRNGVPGRWNNLAGSLRLRTRLEGADAEITAAVGRYDVLLPVIYRDRLFHFSGGVDRLRLNADFSRQIGAVRFRYGAGHDRMWVHHQGWEPGANAWRMDDRSTGATTGGYVDGTWQPDPRVVVRGGLRSDVFSMGVNVVLAPRLSATWLITDQAALTLAGGRYHQFVRIPGALATRIGDFADTVRLPTEMAVAAATHLSLGLDQQLTPGVRLGLEGYYKQFSGLPPAGDDRAYSSGMDVWVRHNAGETAGWFGYSLGWNWARPSAGGHSYRFSGRQLLTAGLTGPVARRTMLGMRVSYGAGLPGALFTALDAAGPGDGGFSGAAPPPVLSGRVDLDTDAPLSGFTGGPYLRMDGELSRAFAPRLAGRVTRVTPFVRVVNALERRDALLSVVEPDSTGAPRGIGTLPLVPVVGFNWHF